MDRATLVDYRIEDGKILLNRLIDDGLRVLVAFWQYSNDDERWGLYVVTDSMITNGIKKSYMLVVLALKGLPGLRIDLAEVTLLEPERPLAAAMIDFINLFPIGYDAWFEKMTMNGVYVELAYVYPVPTTTRPGEFGSARVETPIGTMRW